MDAGDLRVCEYRRTCGKGCAALRSDPGLVLLSADACGIQSLDSYQIAQMEEDMHKMQERMDMDATYRPVVLLEKKYAVYLEAGENVLEALQPTEKERSLIVDNAKLLLIGEFMDAYGYEKTFENEKFVIFE